MIRHLSASLLALTLMSTTTFAQDGPLNRAGRALDNAGRNIRNRVETEVVRGQINAQERDMAFRVSRRLEWDKQLANSAIQLEIQPGGVVILRGSVINDAAKKRTVDLVENTIGVTKIVDELALVKDVKVIEAAPARVIIAPGVETRVVAPGVRVVVPPATEVVVPSETKVIVKP
jgi:hyperosmotically inducible periplasmic protein